MVFIVIANRGNLYYYKKGQNCYKLGQLSKIGAQQGPLNLVKNVSKPDFKIYKKYATCFGISISLRVAINLRFAREIKLILLK